MDVKALIAIVAVTFVAIGHALALRWEINALNVQHQTSWQGYLRATDEYLNDLEVMQGKLAKLEAHYLQHHRTFSQQQKHYNMTVHKQQQLMKSHRDLVQKYNELLRRFTSELPV